MPIAQGQVGEQKNGDGSSPVQGFRQGQQGEMSVSELHGRFYEQAYRGRLFTGGMTLTAISNATFTSATVGATATPIVGLWNPSTSGVNAVILQATLSAVLTALQNTGGAPYVWMGSVFNTAISTGAQPWGVKTLTQSGSGMKNMSGVALTGLTTNLSVIKGSALGGGNLYNIASLSTAAGFTTPHAASVENFDGSFLVPPGGVIALMATTTPVGLSAASGLLWEEVPI
jgi:hypothetical protein